MWVWRNNGLPPIGCLALRGHRRTADRCARSRAYRGCEKRREHTRWTQYHWHEVLPQWLSDDSLSRRTLELSVWHPNDENVDDCRIVAECEESRTRAFATFDSRLIRDLHDHAKIFVG